MTCPCVFITNEAYVPYLGIVMQSIINNASADNTYIFYVFYRDLQAETIDRFKNHIQKFPNCSIEFIDASSYIQGKKFHAGGWVTEVYLKQLAPYVLTGHDKLLYLDSDVIVNIDVAQFFEMDLGNHVVAAGRDIKVIGLFYAAQKWFKKLLPKTRQPEGTIVEMNNPDEYINTGVLLFNAPAFRSAIKFDELMDLSSSREWPGVDQDVLNLVCAGKVLFLPNKYNLQIHCWSGAVHLPERFRAEHAEAKENPLLLHFSHKPWDFAYNTWFFPYFWAAAVRSPYFNELRRQMRGRGCLCDFADEPLGKRLKHLMKEGKKGPRLAFTILLKCSFCTFHRKFLS